MHIALSRIIVVGTTTHSIEFDLTLPTGGYNYPVALTGVQGQGYLHANTTLLLGGAAMNSTATGITFVVNNDAALPVITGSGFLNCSFVVRV